MSLTMYYRLKVTPRQTPFVWVNTNYCYGVLEFFASAAACFTGLCSMPLVFLIALFHLWCFCLPHPFHPWFSCVPHFPLLAFLFVSFSAPGFLRTQFMPQLFRCAPFSTPDFYICSILNPISLRATIKFASYLWWNVFLFVEWRI